MITLVIFALGGTGSDIPAVRYGTVMISILPILLLITSKQYKKAIVFGIVYATVKAAEIFFLPRAPGAVLSLIGLCCMIFVRLTTVGIKKFSDKHCKTGTAS